MGMLTDYFVATRQRAEELAEDGPTGTEVPMLEMKWVEPAVLGSTLWAIIEDVPVEPGQRLPFDLDRFSAVEDTVAVSGDEMSALQQIADGFVRTLAALPDDRIPAIAARWARAEEWVAPWEPGELDDTVRGLRDLARQVRPPDQHMYVWVSM
jgi:hypothetical protein